MSRDNQLESPRELFEQLRDASVRRRLLMLTGPVVIGALVLYHVALFWDRVVSQTLFEPAVGLRWILTLALVWMAWRFRGAGVPLLRGKKALVFWLLVAVLHASFAGPLAVAGSPASLDGSGTALLFVIPATMFAGLVLGLLVSRRNGRSRSIVPSGRRRRWSTGAPSRFLLEAGLMPSLCRRQPPA